MNMKASRGFTLIELLAVIAIMLMLMAATFGTFSVFAERAGPDAVLATIQSYLNTARDYASSNGVTTRVWFTAPEDPGAEGTTIAIQYLPAGLDPANSTNWQAVPGLKPLALQMYVLKDIPSGLFSGLSTALIQNSYTSAANPSDADIALWRDDQKKLLDKITAHAIVSDNKVNPIHRSFYLEIDPSGYLKLNSTTTAQMVQSGLIVAQLTGAGGVTAYAFYPLNSSTATRLVFE